jgi:hypothetical protein
MEISALIRRGALGAISVFLLACSSTPKLPDPVPEPSVIDEDHVPSIRLDGIGDGEFISEKSEVKLKYKVENYPLAENYQKIVFRLNNSAPVSMVTNSGEIVFKEGLRKGANVLRVYLVRAWGESVKNPGANIVRAFFYADHVGISPVSETLPVLTLVSPRGKFYGELGKKILFDLLIQGKAASTSKTKVVRYSLNGNLRDLPVGKPVFFEHLPQGRYVLKVDLIDKPGIRGSVDLSHDESTFEVLEHLPD